GEDAGIVRRALHAVVVGQVVRVAVAVLLAVRLVVLVVVGDEVVEREAVVRGDEVDARPGPAPPPVEHVRRAGKAGGKLGKLPLVAAPVGPYGVAIAVVPLGPARREVGDLVAARTDVPGLGDQLDAGEDRILAAGVQKAAALVEAVGLAGEDR